MTTFTAEHPTQRTQQAPAPPPAGQGMFTPESRLCLEQVAARIAVLGKDNQITWANASWKNALTHSDDPTGLPPSSYLNGPRQREHEDLFTKARETGRTITFRDVHDGSAIETTLTPIGEGRILWVGDPATESIPPSPHAHRAATIHKDWGPLTILSKREREILGLLGSGLTIRVIASHLDRSEKTIEGHRDSIYRKIKVNTRAELSIIAIRAGLLPSQAEPAPGETAKPAPTPTGRSKNKSAA